MDSRRMWSLFEPLHAVTYFTPQAGAAFEAAGLTGYWRRYFAGRAAPLGAVGPEPVVAAFFGFAPAMVGRAFPGVWERITPEAATEARLAGATAALTEVLDGLPVDEAADLLEEAARAVDLPGRVLSAAHAGLAWPVTPIGRLWHAATILREHRGDGHVAALLTVGVGGGESVVWRAGLEGGNARATTQPARGWTDDEWQAETVRLREKNWLAEDGTGTASGRDAYRQIEKMTDRLAWTPWERLGPGKTERCAAVLAPLTERTWKVLPDDNPIPLRRP